MRIGVDHERDAPVAREPRVTVAQVKAVRGDGASQDLLRRLGSQGPEREEAVGELHVLLLKAARFEIRRRSAADW